MASALIRRLNEDQYDEEDKVASSALEFICAAAEGNLMLSVVIVPCWKPLLFFYFKSLEWKWN